MPQRKGTLFLKNTQIIIHWLEDVCFTYPDAKDDLRLAYDDGQLIKSWVVLMGMTLLFLAVTWFLLRREDAAA